MRFIALGLIAIELVGCGAGSASEDDLARRANAICAHYGPSYRGSETATTRAEVVEYLNRTESIAAREERELRALPQSQEQAAQIRRLFDNAHEARRLLAQLRDAELARNDTAALKILRALGPVNRKAKRQLLALGWTECARDPRSR